MDPYQLPPFEVNTSANAAQIKELIRIHCLQENAPYKLVKSEHKQIKARCKNQTCAFMCYASRPQKSSDGTPYIIRKLIAHTCQNHSITTTIKRPASTEYLASLTLIRTKILHNPNISASSLTIDLKQVCNTNLPSHTVKRVRQLCKDELFGTHEDNFRKLPAYLNKLLDLNPGTNVKLELNDGQFHRLFVALHSCIRGFEYCRPLVQIDGTHLHNKYRQVMLTSTTVDAQGQLFPLGFAVVSGENLDNWRWFLHQFKDSFGNNVSTFISDREKGLLEAVRQVYPESNHSYCLRHLTKNVGARFTSLVWKAARAQNVEDLNAALAEIRMNSTKAYDKLVLAGLEHWTTVHFPGLRYGHLTSNAIESLNAWFLGIRGLPVVRMINAIVDKLSVWYEKRLIEANDMNNIICDNVWNRIKPELYQAKSLTTVVVKKGKDVLVQVLAGCKAFIVNVRARTCDCNL
ncbi:hypothetical protein GEMRC1_004656 [Eukaryota sp. GEM-RC1]